MAKTKDGTTAGREPERANGVQELSWQSAMDAPRETADDAPAPDQTPPDQTVPGVSPDQAMPGAAPERSDHAVPDASAGGTDAGGADHTGGHAAPDDEADHGMPEQAEPAMPGAASEPAGTVDFVLAGSPAGGEDGGKPSASGGLAAGRDADPAADPAAGKAGDADALWASLSRDEDVAGHAAAEAAKDVPGSAPEGLPDAAAPKPAKKRLRAGGPFNGKALGPVVPSRPMMRDEEGNLVPTPPSIASRLFTVLTVLPVLLPVVLFLVQVVFTLDTRALWYSDEVRYAAAYQSMADSADWLVLHLNGAVYPDKPPLFFWFLYGLDEAARALSPLLPFTVTVTRTMLFFAGTALSGLLCLLASHCLASLVGRVDRRTVLAADLILLSGFFFAALAHYLRMDLLFAALITFSHVFLFHAWVREKAPLLMTLGFLLAGAAVLTKGPLGLAFPLLAGVVFLLWQGRFSRLFRLDSLFGIVVGLAVPGVWLALAWMNAGDAFLDNILYKQVLARALDTWHHAEPWYHYLATFPLIWLPWTFVLLFLPWGRFMNKGMREGLRASRTPEGAGTAYLWCAFLPGLVLLSLVSIKIPIYCLPLFPPLAVLCAKAVLRMRPLAAACLRYTLAIVLALLGLALVLLPAAPSAYLPIPLVPKGVMVLGGICLLFACMLAFLVRGRRSEGTVLLLALFTTAFAYPAWTVTAPSLDVFLSPRAQAEVIKEYREAGYVPASFKVYPGTYTYYAGPVDDCPSWEDVLALAARHPKMIVALRASFWDALDARPEGFAEVNRQRIAEREYVLVARPPLAPASPAGEDAASEPASVTPDMAAPEVAAPSAPAVSPKPEVPEAAPDIREPASSGAESLPQAMPDASAPAPSASEPPVAPQAPESPAP